MHENNAHQQIHLIKIGIVCLIISLFVIVGGFAAITKQYWEDAAHKETKISILIDEVGELKAENMQLGIELEQKKIRDAAFGNTLSKVNKNLLSLYAITKKNLDETKTETTVHNLKIANQELTQLTEKKDVTIAKLLEKATQSKEKTPIYDSDIIDILILGENQDLTDTIIIASIHPKRKNITLISIPRDIVYKGRKLNELYKKYGIGKLNEAIREITGLTIDKYVSIQFEGFIQLVDQLNGITLNVEKEILDNQYPGENFSYKTVHFQQGIQIMDGKKALEYARSRKSSSDFDRSKRQQKIISAIKQKFIETGLLNQLSISTKIYALISPYIKSNISLFEALHYAAVSQDFTIKTGNLSTQNYLKSQQSQSGQYILLPKEGNYNIIKNYISDLIHSNM